MSEAVVSIAERIEAKRLGDLPFTDLGNAERMIDAYGRDLLHVAGAGWHVWDGRRFRRDDDGAAMRRAKATARAMQKRAAQLGKDGDPLWRHAVKSESRAKLEAAVALAATEHSVLARPADLDADAYQLNVLNGTIDLRTGDLHDHERADRITRLAPVEYVADAHDPRWENFLAATTGDDGELHDLLQRLAGYALTGETSEEIIAFAHGPGATGKSTFLEALKGTLGDYAVTADFETFLKRRDTSGPRAGTAQLAGARLVVSVEVEEGRQLAEALVKTLTGGDTVRGAFLYHDSFEFIPQFTLVLAANHAPRVRDDDDAIWRRILRIPFEHTIPPHRRDRTLKAHLRRPNPAILAWAVRGCLDWQTQGLAPPAAVQAATDAYREEQDPLTNFLADRCDLAPDHRISSADLWAAYRQWAKHAGDEPLTRQAFTDRLTARGCHAKRDRNQRYWTGIQLHRVTRRDAVTEGL